MVETAAIWSPYKIKFAGIGSVVIATMLNKDVFTDKGNFESSVRQFLDTLLSVSGINCQSPCTIKVEISISKAIPKEIFNSEETNLLLEKYFDKGQQVVPEMMDNFSESSTDMPFVYLIQLNKGENFPTKQSYNYTREEKKVLLIGDKSDFDILQQIKLVVESTLFQYNASEIDVRTLIKLWPKNVIAAYVVVASSHTRRTVINTLLNLLQSPSRLDLVPSDGIRHGFSSSTSITIGEDQNWKEELTFHIRDDLLSEQDMELTEGVEKTSHFIEDLTDDDETTSILKHIDLNRLQLDHIDAKDPKYRKMDPGIIDEEQQISNSNQTYGLLQRQLDTVVKEAIIQPKLELNEDADIRSFIKTSNPFDTLNESLHEACSNGDTEKVKMLLEYKVDVNMCTYGGTSPLVEACRKGLTEIVKMLLEYKAYVNKCTDDETSPLLEACRKGETEIVKMLLEYKADVNKCTDDETSPLLEACSQGKTELVKMLLEYKADVNKCKNDGTSPLFAACRKSETEIVKMLLENKADVNRCTHRGISPLVAACKKGLTQIVKILLENKADVNKCTYDGPSPLLAACRNGETEIVKMLLENKVDVNKCTDYGTSPLVEACRKGLTEIVKMLLEYKADVNKCTYDGTSPLFEACRKSETEIVKMLLENKADVNKRTYDGTSPLVEACRKGLTEIVKMLLEYKADVNMCTYDGTSSLVEACRKGLTEIVKMLLEYKVDVNKCTDYGTSPLFAACIKGETEIVKMLLDYKADTSKCTKDGKSALIIAREKGYKDIVTLIENNSSETRTQIGDTSSSAFMTSNKNDVDT